MALMSELSVFAPAGDGSEEKGIVAGNFIGVCDWCPFTGE
ncbi:hypothetical protein FRACA_1580001 [Frankia canadensis]|uniref:Uncharacterized protein n=1 Tax=Frankia canadensis TaxID=1836972 RepID=A0A2I2KMC9_9ACTN|nr:hypothetical protein FRACA_1580001 [Frankia canadensis]SOU54111.1 hypothetical protein FRACA_1580001 [Frankia canadensis]